MLEDHAEDIGVVERNRDLQAPPLVWSLVFGFTAGESRSLADFRRSYNSTADNTLCPSGFYQRLTPTLAEYLRDLVEEFTFKTFCDWIRHELEEELRRRWKIKANEVGVPASQATAAG